MKIKDIALSAAYVGQMVVKAIAVGAHEVWSAIKYIVFKDPAVEQICVANFSSDRIGVLPEDAAKVTSLGLIFRNNTEITSFDELRYFSNLKAVGKADVDISTRDASGIFMDCTSLSSVRLPESVNEIGGLAFRGCANLISINLQFIEHLGYAAFYRSKMDLVLNMPKLKKLYYIPVGTTQLANVFMGTEIRGILDLGEATLIPGGYTEDGVYYGTFSGCDELEYANLEGVEEIQKYAFYNCTNLSRVNFEKIKIIRQYAFYNCTSIKGIDIPSCIQNIEYVAFTGCSSLSRVVLRSVTPVGAIYSFSGCPVDEVFVPDESVSAYRETSYWMAWADRIKPLSQYVKS